MLSHWGFRLGAALYWDNLVDAVSLGLLLFYLFKFRDTVPFFLIGGAGLTILSGNSL